MNIPWKLEAPEWQVLNNQIRESAVTLLRTGGASEAFLGHALSRLAPLRLLYVSTLWADRESVLIDAAIGIGMHMLGVNLIDDLLDADTAFSAPELAFGVLLLQSGATQLCRLSSSDEIQRELETRYLRIYQATHAEIRRRPATLGDWLKLASVKAGEVLECYVAVSCYASGKCPLPRIHRAFARSMGILYMMRDDFTDYRTKHETHGNVIAFLREGHVELPEVLNLVNQVANQAIQALSYDPDLHRFRWLVDEQVEHICGRLKSGTIAKF